MCDVETISKDLQNILCNYRENQNRILINALNDIPRCNGKHFDLMKSVRNKKIRCMTYFSTFMLIIFTFATCGMWFLRRYNYSYTLGGCSSMIFLWPFEECPIAF